MEHVIVCVFHASRIHSCDVTIQADEMLTSSEQNYHILVSLLNKDYILLSFFCNTNDCRSENCKMLSSKNLNTSRTSSHGNRLLPSNQSTVDNFDNASSNLLSNTYNNHNNLATKITIKLTKVDKLK